MQSTFDTLIAALTRHPHDEAARAALADYIQESDHEFTVGGGTAERYWTVAWLTAPWWLLNSVPEPRRRTVSRTKEMRHFLDVCKAAEIAVTDIKAGAIGIGLNGDEYEQFSFCIWADTREPERVIELTRWMHRPAVILPGRVVWFLPVHTEPEWSKQLQRNRMAPAE